MSALPLAVVLSLAAHCAPSMDPYDVAAIAKRESDFNPAAVHINANGTADRGLTGINSTNMAWLGVTEHSVFDPCHAMAATEKLWNSYSRYNTGSPTRGMEYAKRINATAAQIKTEAMLAGIKPIKAIVAPVLHPSPSLADQRLTIRRHRKE